MKLFSFTRKTKKARLIFDIKSESISASFIYLSENARPEIAYSDKVYFFEDEEMDTRRYLTKFMSSFQKISRSASNYLNSARKSNGSFDLEGVNYIFSSPWVISQSKVVNFTKDKSFNVDTHLLEQFLIDESKKIETQEEKKLSTKKNSIDLIMIEEKIIQTKLNGYKTNNIYGRKAKELQLNFILSFCDNELLKKIKTISTEYFGDLKTYFHSFTLASFSIVRDLFPRKRDFLLFDIGGEISDICLCEDESASKIISMPFGKNNILRQVSAGLNVPFAVAKSLINMKCGGDCDEKSEKEVSDALNKAIDLWITELSKVFRGLTPSGDIPRDIFIFVDDEVSKTIAQHIKRDKFQKFKIINNDFNITIIDDPKLNNFITKGKNVLGDSHLKTCVMFLGKIRKSIR